MVTLPPGPVDDWPVDHRVYRYVLGGASNTGSSRYDYGNRVARGRVAAKCLCGWEGVGEQAVTAHEALVRR